jgi:hypothetical protein
MTGRARPLLTQIHRRRGRCLRTVSARQSTPTKGVIIGSVRYPIRCATLSAGAVIRLNAVGGARKGGRGRQNLW